MPHVYLCYKRNIEPDSSLAKRLSQSLATTDNQVFFDENITPGEDWHRATDSNLSQADFLVVLVSEAFFEGAFAVGELERAWTLYCQHGKPVIIPVRVNFSGPCRYPYNVYIDRPQNLEWASPADDGLLTANLSRVFSGEAAVIEQPLPRDLLPFQVSSARVDFQRTTFVAPKGMAFAQNQLRQQRTLWICGEPGSGRRALALQLALELRAKAIFEFPSNRSWTSAAQQTVSDAVFILADALHPARFGDEDLESSFLQLRSLARSNYLVFTSTAAEWPAFERTEAYDQLFRGRRYFELLPLPPEGKTALFSKVTDELHRQGLLNSQQKGWSSELLRPTDPLHSEFTRILESQWSPVDIITFVRVSLPKAASKSDLRQLLEAPSSLEARVFDWFRRLDDSTRVFILALIVADPAWPNFWDYYAAIVDQLRNFDPELKKRPTGISCALAAPYVQQAGVAGFVDERAFSATVKEIARTYREYFLKIIPLLRSWSVPTPKSEDKEVIAAVLRQFEDYRWRIAEAVGEVGKYGASGLEELMHFWAAHQNYSVRKACLVALEVMRETITGEESALQFAIAWSQDFGQGGYRRAIGAMACGYLAATSKSAQTRSSAIRALRVLGTDSMDYVRQWAATAAGLMAKRGYSAAGLDLLLPLARDQYSAVRRRTAEACDEFRRLYPKEVAFLMDAWVGSSDANLFNTALRCTLFGKRISPPDRWDFLKRALVRNPGECLKSLTSLLDSGPEDIEWRRLKEGILNLTRKGQFDDATVAAAIQSIGLDTAVVADFLDQLDQRPELHVVANAIRALVPRSEPVNVPDVAHSPASVSRVSKKNLVIAAAAAVLLLLLVLLRGCLRG